MVKIRTMQHKRHNQGKQDQVVKFWTTCWVWYPKVRSLVWRLSQVMLIMISCVRKCGSRWSLLRSVSHGSDKQTGETLSLLLLSKTTLLSTTSSDTYNSVTVTRNVIVVLLLMMLLMIQEGENLSWKLPLCWVWTRRQRQLSGDKQNYELCRQVDN